MIRSHADSIIDSADIINAETDIKIFINHHKSKNQILTYDQFQPY